MALHRACGVCLLAAILLLVALVPSARAALPNPPSSFTLVDRGLLPAPGPNFWAISAHTATNKSWTSSLNVGKFVNSTPIRFIRIGDGSDACNLTTNTFWVAGMNGGIRSGGCKFNINETKAWCYSITPHCVSLLQLPGENNNPGEDANMTHFVLVNESFRPDFIAIGNEPDSTGVWTHFGEPWTAWKTSDTSTANATTYAADVRAAVPAVAGVYKSLGITPLPTFVGIEAASPSANLWFQAIANDASLATNPLKIGAIAYHSYPANVTDPTLVTLSNYEGSLVNGAKNLTSTLPLVRSEYLSGCHNGSGTCPVPSIQVGEYNGGPGGGAPALDAEYPGVTFIASSVCQALETSVPMFTYFDLQSHDKGYNYSMMNNGTALTPVGNLTKDIMPYLAGANYNGGITEVHNTSAAPENFWSVMVTDVAASHGTTLRNYSLLMVNANITRSVTITTSPVFPTGASGVIANWSGGGTPTFKTASSFASSYTLPANSLLLLSGLTLTGAAPSNGSSGNLSGGPTPGAPGGSSSGNPASSNQSTTGDPVATPRQSSRVARKFA